MPATSSTRFETGHVGLNVSDLERAKRFYSGVFGFSILQESADGDRRFAFLADGDRLVLTLWEQSDGRFTGDRPGLHHLSFQVASIDDVRAAERRIRDLGGTVHHDGIVPHAEGMDSGGVFFEDPDGIRLEIFASTGAASAGAAPNGAAPTCGFF
jgi:catechol 2,3-dioxygenase-like lactoylglutathione lyase family enzyme